MSQYEPDIALRGNMSRTSRLRAIRFISSKERDRAKSLLINLFISGGNSFKNNLIMKESEMSRSNLILES